MTENTQMREAFEADQFADLWPDAAARERDGDGYRYLVVDANWRQWQAAWTASRKAALEEAAKVCEQTYIDRRGPLAFRRLAHETAADAATAIRAEIDK